MSEKSGGNSDEDLDQFTLGNGSSFMMLMAVVLLSLTIILSVMLVLCSLSANSVSKNTDSSNSDSCIDHCLGKSTTVPLLEY